MGAAMRVAKKSILSLFIIVLFACPTVLAFMSYPANLEGKISQYPGSTIIQTTSLEQSTQVMLQTSDSLDNVANYYKKDLEKNGLHTEMENKQQNGWTIIFSSPEQGSGMVGLYPDGKGNIAISIVYSSK